MVSDRPLASGDRVAGRFVIDGLAGSGSMGAVYVARDAVSGARIALKVLLGAGEHSARFDREIRVIARLHHPRIVRYMAHGTTDGGSPFLAMEWLEGETLQARLDRTALTAVEAIEVGRGVSEALVAAHSSGIIHRDLKPANIMLVNGSVEALKVVDFGIARLAGDGPRLTVSGDIVGTPVYMSPEQALSRKDVDARSDIFSLGCVLFYGLSGAYPFAADTPLRVLLKLTTEAAPPLSILAPRTPPTLATLVDSMLARSPNDRPPNAANVHAALSSIRADLARPGDQGPSGAIKAASTPVRNRRFQIVSLSLLLAGALAIAGIIIAWLLIGRPRRSPALARAADGSCPTKALGCAHLSLRDPTRADPLDVAAAAQAVAATLGGGGVISVTTERLTKNGVDLSTGGDIVVRVAHGRRIVVDATRMVVYRDGGAGGEPVAMPDPGGCDVKAAYAAALNEGLKSAEPWKMTFSNGGDGTGYLFVAPDDEKWTRLLFIRAVDCERGSVTLP